MKLYVAVRWGNPESPDGPDGEDTHFLIRAHDFLEAAQLADEALRSLATSSAASRHPVQDFCHRIIEIGSDGSSFFKVKAQVLMGPWVGFGCEVHHVGYATWERGPEKNEWEKVKHDA
jgi:hypothetical protein